MECYKCQAVLNESNLCPGCKTDVKIYKKIVKQSNFYYNEGLLKAQVRDLSGAVICLRRSLKYNKMNVEARNLLGLVYFEMGETVDALSQWVISRNLKQEDNLAEVYLKNVQSSGNKLETMNQTIKKYNQALTYCKQGSRDLAILQLKKVVSLNPKFVKGHQLLALLYIQEDKRDLAIKSLKSAINIDGNNTTTLRYLSEVDENFKREIFTKKNVTKESIKNKKGAVSYQSGNDTIIKPINVKDYSPIGTIVNLVIGIAIGTLISWFLLVPNVKQNAKSEANKAVLEASDTISDRNLNIKSLENDIKKLETEISKLKEESNNYEEVLNVYENLVVSFNAFTNDEIQKAGETLALVKPESLRPTSKEIYDTINAQVGERYIQELFEEGEKEYRQNNYQVAIEYLTKVIEIDEQYENGEAIYHLAHSYRKIEDIENQKTYYQKVVDLFPGTEKARTSQYYLQKIM